VPTREWEDEYTLLCERCGYVIEGLPRDGACPECGRPIEDSLPERRTGTPWQRDGLTLRAIASTWLMTLSRPRTTLDQIRFDRGRPSVVAFFFCLPWLQLMPLLLFLTWLEARGLGFIAARRGFRLSRHDAYMITAHGAAFWAIGWVPVWLTIIIVSIAEVAGLRRSSPVSDLSIIASTVAIALPSLAGFLLFETFAYLGLRRCRFANRVRPAPGTPRQPDQHEPEITGGGH